MYFFPFNICSHASNTAAQYTIMAQPEKSQPPLDELRFCTDIHVPQKTNPTDFGDPLT